MSAFITVLCLRDFAPDAFWGVRFWVICIHVTEYRNVEEKAQIHRYLQCFRRICSRQSRVGAYAIGVEVGFGGVLSIYIYIYIYMYMQFFFLYIYICVYIYIYIWAGGYPPNIS